MLMRSKRIRSNPRVIAVASGKGGVGKTMTAINLAYSLKDKGYDVGLLDVDTTGSNIPKILGLTGSKLSVNSDNIEPVLTDNGIKVMGVGLLTPSDDTPVVFRGSKKYNYVKQFIDRVKWGEIDYLVIDFPPGWGEEFISVMDLFKKSIYGVVIVTIPSKMSIIDVRKTASLCKKLKLNIICLVNNMSLYKCCKCGNESNVFCSGDMDKFKTDYNIDKVIDLPIVDKLDSNILIFKDYFKYLEV